MTHCKIQVLEEKGLEIDVLLHVRFIPGPKVGSPEPVVVGLGSFLSPLSEVQGGDQPLFRFWVREFPD